MYSVGNQSNYDVPIHLFHSGTQTDLDNIALAESTLGLVKEEEKIVELKLPDSDPIKLESPKRAILEASKDSSTPVITEVVG